MHVFHNYCRTEHFGNYIVHAASAKVDVVHDIATAFNGYDIITEEGISRYNALDFIDELIFTMMVLESVKQAIWKTVHQLITLCWRYAGVVDSRKKLLSSRMVSG